MKFFLFNRFGVIMIVKAPNEFIAACYGNQRLKLLEQDKNMKEFDTHDAIELDNDMYFGVKLEIRNGNIQLFNRDNKYYKK